MKKHSGARPAFGFLREHAAFLADFPRAAPSSPRIGQAAALSAVRDWAKMCIIPSVGSPSLAEETQLFGRACVQRLQVCLRALHHFVSEI